MERNKMIEEYPMSLDSFDIEEARILDSLYSDLELTMLNLTRNILNNSKGPNEYFAKFGDNEYGIIIPTISNWGVVNYLIKGERPFNIEVVIGDNYCDINIRGITLCISQRIKRFIKMYKEMIKESK